MKTLNIQQKLSLNKKTIANLANRELKRVMGGATAACPNPDPTDDGSTPASWPNCITYIQGGYCQ